MNQEQNKISCPKCGEEINVNDILYHQVKEQLKKQYNDEYSSQSRKLKKDQDALEDAKDKQSEQVNKQVKDELKKQEISLRKKYKTEAEEEQSDAINSLQKENQEKTRKLKEFNKTKADLEKTKREKDELEEFIKAESEKELNQKLKIEKVRIQKKVQDENELKHKELEKQLADQIKLTDEMKRKQEQGSMQIQGEVQELGIKEWLSSQFTLDTIVEIKKGERGADCLQTVNTRTHQNCGTIYYESKRTKVFQKNWIEKFKADIVEKKADIGVLVTETMPTDMSRFGLKDGIWVCSFEEFKGLCVVFRESIISISAEITNQDNKGEKMAMLYDFLTSNEFRLQIEAIVEGFTQMKTDLFSEKRAMTKIWSKREKQIERVITNTSRMHGSIKGIAGNAIKTVPLLELSSDDKDDINHSSGRLRRR